MKEQGKEKEVEKTGEYQLEPLREREPEDAKRKDRRRAMIFMRHFQEKKLLLPFPKKSS